MKIAAQVKAGEHVVWNAVPGELVLLNADTGAYYALDAVGADLWRRLMETPSVADAKEFLAARYEASAETVAADVDRLVGELLENGLLVPKDDPAD